MPGSEDEEQGDDGAAAQQTHRFVWAWLEPHPGGSVCRAAAQAAAQSELGQCPDLRAKRKATTVPRRSRHTGLSGRGWSHAPGGSVCRDAAEAAARSRSSKRACDTGPCPPAAAFDWSRAALPVVEVVPLASPARSGRAARRTSCSCDGQLHSKASPELSTIKTAVTCGGGVRCPSLLFSGPSRKKTEKGRQGNLVSVPPLSTKKRIYIMSRVLY